MTLGVLVFDDDAAMRAALDSPVAGDHHEPVHLSAQTDADHVALHTRRCRADPAPAAIFRPGARAARRRARPGSRPPTSPSSRAR